MTDVITGEEHAELSASGSYTWLNCPGSVKAQRAYPNTSNKYAEDGTLTHELADMCLSSGDDASKLLGTEVSLFSNGKFLSTIVDEDRAIRAQFYIDYVRSHENVNTKLHTEDRVDFSNIVPEGFGTLDAAVLDYKTGVCNIFDLKDGNTRVYAENNTQGLMYALGMYNELGFLDVIKSFRIHIVMPRPKLITHWDISLKDLIAFGEYAKVRGELALSNDAERIPGDKQCHWCRARFDCTTRDKHFTKITDDFVDLDPVDTTNISNERIAEILADSVFIEGFLKDIGKVASSKLHNGEVIPGYKLVLKGSNRVWNDSAESVLNGKLNAAAYKKTLIGITAAEKLLSKEEIDELTFNPPGKIGMVTNADKRDAVEFITDDFDTLD